MRPLTFSLRTVAFFVSLFFSAVQIKHSPDTGYVKNFVKTKTKHGSFSFWIIATVRCTWGYYSIVLARCVVQFCFLKQGIKDANLCRQKIRKNSWRFVKKVSKNVAKTQQIVIQWIINPIRRKAFNHVARKQ